MARNLYRFYLYTIFIALIVFTVGVTSQLLGTLFEFTSLRGTYATAPTQTTLVQALVFAIVGWIISGALGGLHYWLIRRDQKQDPAAGGSAIRAFFLNITEGIGVLIAVSLIGFSAIGNWAYGYNSGAAYALGTALPVLLMVLGLELERRRFPAHEGTALVFQRLHFFGGQLILFFMLTGAFFSNGLRPLIDIVFFGGQGECRYEYCSHYQAAGLALLLLWFLVCWLIYGLITSRDMSRLTRMILHGISLALGISFLLGGVFIALEVGVSPLFHVSLGFNDVLGFGASHDFVTPLTLGLVATIVYHLLLQNIIRRNLIGRATLLLTEAMIAALLLASLFWWGCGSLLYNLLQMLAPSPATPDAQSWITTLALLIPGLVYIPLDLVIRRRFALDPASALGPRRGLVLALLAAGILALAIGGAVALYAWLTALLGSPLTNWPQLAHSGLAAAIVGAALVGIYIWPLRDEHLLARPVKTEQPPAPEQPSHSPIIEDILDDLLAGRISRAEAAARIRSLQGTATLLLI